MKVSLLSVESSPILGRVIEAFLNAGVEVDSILYDSKVYDPKNLSIWEERTEGKLPPIKLSEFERKAIPVFYVKDHSSNVTAELVQERGIDLLVNSGTPRILKEPILSAPRVGVVNCHPGILPNYRGCTSVEWALYEDGPVGNTVHLMTCEIDEGPVLATEEISIEKGATYAQIRTLVYLKGWQLMAQAVADLSASDKDPWKDDYPTGGRYNGVIEADKMQVVHDKLGRNELGN